MNFPKLFKNWVFCPLKCEQQNQIKDTQEHLLQCKKLNTANIESVKIDDAYACIAKQEAIAKVISKVIRKRSRMIEDMDKNITRLPGAILDQSAPHPGAAAL